MLLKHPFTHFKDPAPDPVRARPQNLKPLSAKQCGSFPNRIYDFSNEELPKLIHRLERYLLTAEPGSRSATGIYYSGDAGLLLQCFHKAAVDIITFLELVTKQFPEDSQIFARECSVWPVNLLGTSAELARCRRTLATLEVGKKYSRVYDYRRSKAKRGFIKDVTIALLRVVEKLAHVHFYVTSAHARIRGKDTDGIGRGQSAGVAAAREINFFVRQRLSECIDRMNNTAQLLGLPEPTLILRTLLPLASASFKLPPLTQAPASIAQWHEHLKLLLNFFTEGKPEENRLLWKNVAKSKRVVERDKGLDGKVPAKKVKANVKSGIYGEMKQALKNVAPDSASDGWNIS